LARKKIKLDVNEFLEDIQLGMDDENLIEKYNLTQALLIKAFDKMVAMGYITDEDLYNRTPLSATDATIEFSGVFDAISELE
jgi:hypothetical protein